MDRRVLSIQSHVVSGYVGNKAAVFPLQVLGYDVDAINTVHFSNHAGYRRFGGSKATASDIDTVINSMSLNGLINHSRLLTGFIPDAAALESVAKVANELRTKQPNKLKFIYLLDPVMGDDGRLYVSGDVVPVYRDVLLPLATIITPNWYEVELLTGIEINSFESIRAALRVLHVERGVPHVVISSIPMNNRLAGELAQLPALTYQPIPGVIGGADGGESLLSVTGGEDLLCITSSATSSRGSSKEAVSEVGLAVVPRIPGYFSGVGDLFSALVLAHFHPPANSDAELLASNYASSSVGSGDSTYDDDSGEEAAAAVGKDIVDATTGTGRHATVPSVPPTPPTSAEALRVAVRAALATTEALLEATNAHCKTLPEEECPATDDEKDGVDPERRVRRMRARELRIVQGLDVIRCPPDNVGLVTRWDGFWN